MKQRKIYTMRQKSIERQCYLMLLLPIIGFIVFTIYPISWVFKWSLFSYNQVPSQTRFIGFENFKMLFTADKKYWASWITTLEFTFCKMPLELTLAMFLGLFLHQTKVGTNVFRSIYFLPNVVSVAIIGLVFSNMFGHFGWVNSILMKLGVISKEVDWFSQKSTAIMVLVLGSVWNTFGINVMYILAALTNVPEDVYEAAALDGAVGAKKFFKITLPMISPVFATILLLSLVGTLGVNDYIITLTNGAPAGSTLTVMSYITKQYIPGFAQTAGNLELGYGCAMSLITTVIFGFIAFSYNKVSDKMKHTM